MAVDNYIGLVDKWSTHRLVLQDKVSPFPLSVQTRHKLTLF